MSRADRAKIFTPFDPLKGFREALRERERAHEAVQRAQLAEDRTGELEWKIASLVVGDEVAVTSYRDGAYELHEGAFAGLGNGCMYVGDAVLALEDVFDIDTV